MRILITAGPTREPIDPVRYIANRSSGGMGQGLAAAAIRDGHFVTLILGPVSISMPKSAKRIDVETSREMHAAVLAEFPKHDLLIMAAAVADYRPKWFTSTSWNAGTCRRSNWSRRRIFWPPPARSRGWINAW
jgi:phosphopantothenoylcysteine synthetase/decarboxylase